MNMNEAYDPDQAAETMKDIVVAIRGQYRLPWRGLHGVDHWGRVLENGLRLAGATGAVPEVVQLFAIFHDACRRNESVDPGHGRRGAELAKAWLGDIYELSDDRFELLYDACQYHTNGMMEGDPTVLTCWDADRLDLSRAAITPKAKRMGTEAGRDPEIIQWAIDRSLRRHTPRFVEEAWIFPEDKDINS